MDIILIRHGLAQDRGGPLPDRDRELVPRGIRKTKEAVDVLRRRLKKGRPVILLSSPAARALQTAEVVARELGRKGIDGVHECIYTGDTDALLQVLEAQPQDSSVLVVGHEPDLSRWAHLFSGADLRLRKSGMAGFSSKHGGPLAARLRWRHRAPLSKPASGNKELGAGFTVSTFQNIMIHRVLAILEARQDFLARPDRARTVHQLRIALRQARSLLSFMRPALEGPALESAQDSLRRVARSLSRLRELDVFRRQWRDHRRQHPDIAADRALDDALKQERSEELAAALPLIQAQETEDALRAVLQWVDRWDLDLGRETSLLPAARKRLKRWHKAIRKGTDALDVQDLPRTHALRLRIKKARYAQECIPPLQAIGGPDPEHLKELQEVLGDICDTHAHQDLLEELGRTHPVPREDPAVALFIRQLADKRAKLSGKVTGDDQSTSDGVENPS